MDQLNIRREGAAMNPAVLEMPFSMSEAERINVPGQKWQSY